MYFYQNDRLSLKIARKFLQVQGNIRPHSLFKYNNHCGDKSTSLFTPLQVCGSITLETTLVLPIFMLAMVVVMYFIMILNFQIMLNMNISNAVRGIMSDSYRQQEDSSETGKELFTKLYAWNKVMSGEVQKIKEELDIYNMLVELDMEDANPKDEEAEGNYRLRVSYCVPVPMIHEKVYRLRLVNQCYFRGFNGESIAKENREEKVYITERGTVYHLYEDCSHIHLSVLKVNYEAIAMLRNTSGAKYKKCEKCIHSKVQKGELLLITTDGNRYHRAENCSGIKRTVKEVKKESVENRTVCKRCKEREEQKK
jgi:hypothetical protein